MIKNNKLAFYILFLFSLSITFSSCSSKLSSADNRKKQLEKKKRKHPDDCPKIDC